MSSNSNATNKNSIQNSNSKNTTVKKNQSKYLKFDTILKKSSNIYDNYLLLVNEFIESKLTNVNNKNFYNSSKEGFNSNNNISSLDTQKRIYLNTYVIPLLYLINSYQYQKYFNNTIIIQTNQEIMSNINFYKNFLFNYKSPIIKSVNIDIYKYIYGSNSSNNTNTISSKSRKKKKTNIKKKNLRLIKVLKKILVN